MTRTRLRKSSSPEMNFKKPFKNCTQRESHSAKIPTLQMISSTMVPAPDKMVVRNLVLEIIQEPNIREILLEILDDPNPSPKTLLQREAILNGSFYFQAKSGRAFPYAPEIVKFQFGSSHIKAKGFDRSRFDQLVNKAIAQGIGFLGSLFGGMGGMGWLHVVPILRSACGRRPTNLALV
mmetsp:Transcript_11130/g.21304  ORF Transcript_11130/g.21304 Transcript_11130/m.21304 type:complete len:179 (+) Transcript_11130:442-978(+)